MVSPYWHPSYARRQLPSQRYLDRIAYDRMAYAGPVYWQGWYGFEPRWAGYLDWMEMDVYSAWHEWQREISMLHLSASDQRAALMQNLSRSRQGGSRRELEELAEKLLQTTRDLGADEYGRVEEITTTTSTTVTQQATVMQRAEVANLMMAAMRDNGTSQADISKMLTEVNNGSKDAFVLREVERLKTEGGKPQAIAGPSQTLYLEAAPSSQMQPQMQPQMQLQMQPQMQPSGQQTPAQLQQQVQPGGQYNNALSMSTVNYQQMAPQTVPAPAANGGSFHDPSASRGLPNGPPTMTTMTTSTTTTSTSTQQQYGQSPNQVMQMLPPAQQAPPSSVQPIQMTWPQQDHSQQIQGAPLQQITSKSSSKSKHRRDSTTSDGQSSRSKKTSSRSKSGKEPAQMPMLPAATSPQMHMLPATSSPQMLMLPGASSPQMLMLPAASSAPPSAEAQFAQLQALDKSKDKGKKKKKTGWF